MSEVWQGPSETTNGPQIPRTAAAIAQLVIVAVSVVTAVSAAAWVGYHSDLGWMYTAQDGYLAGLGYGLIVGVPYGLHAYFWAPRRSVGAAAMLVVGAIATLPLAWYLIYLAIGGWEFPLPADFLRWFADHTQSFQWEYADGRVQAVGVEMHLANGFACVGAALAVGLLPWARKTCPACDGRANVTLIGMLYEPLANAVESTKTLAQQLHEDRNDAIASWLALAPYPRPGQTPTGRVRVSRCMLCRGEHVTLSDARDKSPLELLPVPQGSYLPLAVAVKRSVADRKREQVSSAPEWKGDQLQLPMGARLPDRCPICAEPGVQHTTLEFRKFGSTSVIMLFVAWPLALMLRDSLRFEVNYCAAHAHHVRRRNQGGLVVMASIALPFIAMFIAICALPKPVPEPAGTTLILTFMVGCIVLPIAMGLWWSWRYPELISKTEMTKAYVRARGFHPQYLDD